MMERLTDKREADAQREAYKCRLENGYPRNIPEERYLRLAAYEDTGLTPEQCENVKSIIESVFADDTSKAEHIIELLKADKEGRVVVLPCKGWFDIVFGEQTVFYGIDTYYIENPIREITVDDGDRIGWYDGWKTVYLKGTDDNGQEWQFLPDNIGKTVFLTREEAEEALRG